MKNASVAGIVAVLAAAVAAAAGGPTSAPAGRVLGEAFPRLVSGALVHARLAALPDAALLKAGEFAVSEKELDDQIAKAPEDVQPQLRKNALFVLEQIATRRLLLAEAGAAARKDGKDPSKLAERELLQGYLQKLTAGVEVTEKEISEFYRANTDMVGGAPLETVREAVRRYLLQRKRQEKVDRHVRTLGKRTAIEVSGTWAPRMAALAIDNPVDKARASGRPSLVDFGAETCVPCKMMEPILQALRAKHRGKANVIFVSVRKEQVLAGRYGIQSIPVQIFFDKDGEEVFRHVGFYPQDEIEKKLAELGVK